MTGDLERWGGGRGHLAHIKHPTIELESPTTAVSAPTNVNTTGMGDLDHVVGPNRGLERVNMTSKAVVEYV